MPNPVASPFCASPAADAAAPRRQAIVAELRGDILAGRVATGVQLPNEQARARRVVSTRLPTAAEADALVRAGTQPARVVDDANVDAEGGPVEAATALVAAGAVRLGVEPDAPP